MPTQPAGEAGALPRRRLHLPGRASPLRDGEPRGVPSAHLPPTAFVLFLQNHDQIGNRAFGERLTTLAQPAALEAAIALLLLCPQIPLLFMGEETRAGRRSCSLPIIRPDLPMPCARGGARSSPKFPAFSDPATRGADSRSQRAARRSPRRCRSRTPRGSGARGAVSAIARIAASEIVPRLDGTRSLRPSVIGPKAVVARWRLGDGAILTMASNLGADTRVDDLPTGAAAVCHARCAIRPMCCLDTAPVFSLRASGCRMNDEAMRDLARRAGMAVEWRDHAGKPQWCPPRCCADARRARTAVQHAQRCPRQPSATAARSTMQAAAAADHRDAGRPTRLESGPTNRVTRDCAWRQASARISSCHRCAGVCACRRSADRAITAC